MSYDVHRSGIQVGMRTVSDAYHVRWKTLDEEVSIASFWISDRQAPVVAEGRARLLADALNAGISAEQIGKRRREPRS